MPGIWTITYNGTEQSAAAWGFNAQPVIRTRDRSPTRFSFFMAGAAPESGIPFPFKAQVNIRQNRTGSGTSWSFPATAGRRKRWRLSRIARVRNSPSGPQSPSSA